MRRIEPTPAELAMVRVKLARAGLESAQATLRLVTRAGASLGTAMSQSAEKKSMRQLVAYWDRELARALKAAEALP